MEELLSLKWNNHKSTFIHVLGILRDKQLYTDATIACEGKFYNVHKLVLSTCSDYFSAMLDRTNCKNPVIVLKDIKCEDLEALLDYMYLGEVNVRQSDLATLIKAAECLRVKGLAVPDDEPPPPRKTKASENQSRRGDTSGSPPVKRKRRSEVDDGRDDVRPSKIENRSSSPIHRAKSPSAPMSTPLSPVHNRNTPVRQPTEATVPPSPKASMHLEDSNTDGNANNNSMTNNQGYQPSDHSEPFVKVEMDDGGGGEVETYDLSNEGGFKEEGGDDGAHSGGGGGESGGDLSNDLPEFLQQAASNPLQGGAFGHSSFAGSSSFQPGELPGWQGDGSNIGFPHLNFGSTEGSSQQNAPGKCEGDPAADAGEANLNQVEPICLLDENVSTAVSLDVDTSQVDAMTMFCRRLKVDPSQLLSKEFLQNTEFMELMTSTASTARHYNELVSTWQGNQRFMKKVSDVFAKYRLAETALDELATSFIQINKDKAAPTKDAKEKIQDNSALIEMLINLLRKAKKLMDQVVPGLQACIRAQKARRLSKIRASIEALQEQGGPSEPRGTASTSLNDAKETTAASTDYISYDMLESMIEGQRSPVKDEDTKSSSNKCRVCSETFHNRYQLIKHQNVEGHKLKRGRPSTSADDA